jgi:glyoxylase-like metal-dependent hydrolase (beta-lactamase superfamily II)
LTAGAVNGILPAMPALIIGPWTLHTLETGHLWLDGGSMFGSVPKPLWNREHPADERNRIRLAMRCLLLDDGRNRVLIDVGIGDKFSPKLVDIYRVESGLTLNGALAGAGFEASDITDVVLTHLHFDHAAGATRESGGRLVPSLPNARYHVRQANLDNARSPNPRERASYMPENFEPLADDGVLIANEDTTSPWPGVTFIQAEGHTRGQRLVRIAADRDVVYFVADVIPTRSHVRIPFVMGYDMAVIETMEEKRALLARAVEERAWVCLEHDPEVALARPVAEGDDFGWAERVSATAETVPARS